MNRYNSEIIRDDTYDKIFQQIEKIRWYPFVGSQFKNSKRKLFIYAHNIPTKREDYETRINKFSEKAYWARYVGEYTFCKGNWTHSFRSFVKGAVGFSNEYSLESPIEKITVVKNFINRIAYLNYIQDLVIGDNIYTNATNEQIIISKEINNQILSKLEITDCICWGAKVYSYLINDKNTKIIKKEKINKKGFESCTINKNGQVIRVLKVYHPSMPGFGMYKNETHSIIQNFFREFS